MSAFSVSVNPTLLRKYDREGPRYTSYPSATHFHSNISYEEYLSQIIKDEREITKRELSLYFHIPFCDTLCYFCGCNMMVSHDQSRINKYLIYLLKEIDLLRSLLGADRKVVQLQWGGGTPTHLSPDQIRFLGKEIRRRFEFKMDAETGVEIDPRELTPEHMVALKEVGFNRCSMGVQDFNPDVQRAVNRVQPENITRRAIKWARDLGFKSLNLDLMYGLPHQNRENFSKTLDTLIELDPDRVAVFNYAHLPGILKHQSLIKEKWLPGPEEKLQMLKISIEKLTQTGYVYIGMDHFSKPEDDLAIALEQGTLYRNFQGYSTHSGIDLFAFGISGIGSLSEMYMQNFKSLKSYHSALDKNQLPFMRGVILTMDDLLRREIITRLMCHFRLNTRIIANRYGLDFDHYFHEPIVQLKKFQQDGLVSFDGEVVHVTDQGRLFIRNIAMCFDAYLINKGLNRQKFSRTI